MLLALVGCGDDSISVEDLPDEIEGARCDTLVKCEGIADRATCDAAVVVDESELMTIEAGIKNGTIKYDEGQAADCIDQLGGGSCDFAGFHTENACAGVFTGTVVTGGACTIDLQCANQGECMPTSPSCDPETTCCAGTCMGGSSESAIGGPCDDDMHTCPTTAYCKAGTGSGTPGTCTALVAGEGTACTEIDACVNPLYCNLNFQTGMGTCKKPAASGAACTMTDLIRCSDSRDYCNATSMTCVRRIAVGQACMGSTMPCVDYASCIAGTCVADIPLGGTCNPETGPNCAGDLECVGTTCQVGAPGLVCTL